ncbi:RNA-binding cell elongation regulator Jag/EloR [Chloroflexota bacterium]
MENLEMNGKTVEEATQRALEELGVKQSEVKVTVLKEGKNGVLGLGSEEARIRMELLADIGNEDGDTANIAGEVLETLLGMMGLSTQVMPVTESFVEEEDVAPVNFNITGDDLGILIGRRGQTLSCLQYIVRLIVGHQTENWIPITIDVEGYKQRRYEALKALALRVSGQVEALGESFALEPMSAYERRIIHLSLASHKKVVTESVGEGESRRVVILPKE